jgi:O-acetyl-ADP-ribose deacetylase
MRIELHRGDITEQRVDAIVNAANSSLLGGGGVDGAIHYKGGPTILDECRALRRGQYADGLPPGQAVATTAGNLSARWVIHTVGPVYRAREDRTAVLRACYANSLTIANELGVVTVAFPLISSGAFAWPVDDAVRQALTALRSTAAQTGSVVEARLVLFDAATFAVASRVYGEG